MERLVLCQDLQRERKTNYISLQGIKLKKNSRSQNDKMKLFQSYVSGINIFNTYVYIITSDGAVTFFCALNWNL